MYREKLIAVRAKLKGGKMRYVPMPPELAAEFKRYPVVWGRIGSFLQSRVPSANDRVDKSFETILEMAGIEVSASTIFGTRSQADGGDLYELAKILGHSNIKMTKRYAKLAKSHIARTRSTAREMWRLMEGKKREQIQGAA